MNDSPSSSSTPTSPTRTQEAPEKFPTYDSPFESYPLLRSRLRMLSDEVQHKATHSTGSLPSFVSMSIASSVVSPKFIPNLKPLKKAASFKALDPSKQICRYELPGGGVCRDVECQDVHLSRGLDGLGVDGVEPTGTWL